MEYSFLLMGILLESKNGIPGGLKEMDSLLKARFAEGYKYYMNNVRHRRELKGLNEERNIYKVLSIQAYSIECLASGKKTKSNGHNAVSQEADTSNTSLEMEQLRELITEQRHFHTITVKVAANQQLPFFAGYLHTEEASRLIQTSDHLYLLWW